MPFQSKSQRAFLYEKHPDIAKRWEKETPKGKKLPIHKKGSKSDKRNKNLTDKLGSAFKYIKH